MCKDVSVNYLNSVGYNVIRLPREGIEPLSVLSGEKSRLELLGPIQSIMLEADQPPAISSGQAADINGKRTSKFDLSFGLKLLEKLLEALGAPSAGLDIGYKRAQKIEFEFKNVQFSKVDVLKLGEFLTKGTPNVFGDLMESLNDEGEAYVITEVIKSNTFTTSAYDNSGTNVGINLAGIKDVLGASAKVDVSQEGESKATFKGDKLLSFGFKASPIWIQTINGDARFRFKRPVGDGISFDLNQQLGNVIFSNELVRIR